MAWIVKPEEIQMQDKASLILEVSIFCFCKICEWSADIL